MQVPYTTQPREDTGLYNAKLGVWLFLASEVMLFGGLFSAYVLLRVGAPGGLWPSGWQNIPLGTLNTFILITSSITMVLSWASLKARDFAKFKLFQGLTLLLAIVFLGVKMVEYSKKFSHYEIRLNDQLILADGKKIYGNAVAQTNGVTVFAPAKGLGHYDAPVKYPAAEVKSVLAGKVVDGHLHERTAEEVVIEGRVVDRPQDLLNLRTREAREAKTEEFKLAPEQIRRMQNYGPWHHTYLASYFAITALHALHVLGGIVIIFYFWGPGSRMLHTDPERFTNRIEVSGLYWHFVDLVWIFVFPTLYLL
jgi:cytochrome c oxidase subunit III